MEDKRNQINFHPRPSFPGEGLEKKQRYAINTKFNEKSIYVWNIDETPLDQIYDILNNMLTCYLAYESSGHSNVEVAMHLINKFSGSLKLGWNHALTN